MRYIVTGSSGFIGADLCKKILNEPNNQVVGIDNMNEYYDTNLKNDRLATLEKYPNFSFYKLNIANKEKLFDVFETFRPDYVINLAAQAGVRYSIENPDVYILSNIVGFYNVLEACRKYPVKHLVYASSSSVYGDNGKIPYSTEDKTDSPVSLYAATKKSNELLAYSYAKLYKIPSTGLRFFTVYGPWGRPDMAYFKFTKKLLKGEAVEIFNYGNCKRDFTYIDDVIRCISKIIPLPPESTGSIAPHGVYNVGHGQPVNLLDFVTILQEELIKVGLLPEDYDLEAHKKLLPMQPGDVISTYADTGPLEKKIHFRPTTNLREGLRNFAEWYIDYKGLSDE